MNLSLVFGGSGGVGGVCVSEPLSFGSAKCVGNSVSRGVSCRVFPLGRSLCTSCNGRGVSGVFVSKSVRMFPVSCVGKVAMTGTIVVVSRCRSVAVRSFGLVASHLNGKSGLVFAKSLTRAGLVGSDYVRVIGGDFSAGCIGTRALAIGFERPRTTVLLSFLSGRWGLLLGAVLGRCFGLGVSCV